MSLAASWCPAVACLPSERDQVHGARCHWPSTDGLVCKIDVAVPGVADLTWNVVRSVREASGYLSATVHYDLEYIGSCVVAGRIETVPRGGDPNRINVGNNQRHPWHLGRSGQSSGARRSASHLISTMSYATSGAPWGPQLHEDFSACPSCSLSSVAPP